MTDRELCWAFHVSAIPATTEQVITVAGDSWHRAGPRSWRQEDGETRYHEAWMLENHGPVRCPQGELLLAERDGKLAAQLRTEECWAWLPGPEHDTAGREPVAFEDAMALMRAGWLAWSPKQRRDALASLRERDRIEAEVTS